MAEWDQRSFDGVVARVPPGWDVSEDVPGVELVISGPVIDGFRPNVSISRGKAANPSLQSQFTQQLAELRSILTDSALLDLEETELAGVPAQRLLVSFRQGIYDLILEQWIALTGERMLAVVSACATAQAWEQHEPMLRKIVSSVRF